MSHFENCEDDVGESVGEFTVAGEMAVERARDVLRIVLKDATTPGAKNEALQTGSGGDGEDL